MFKNYFKIAWRNLVKHKTFAMINILGLSIGISVCFIIMLFVLDELSYDRFNEKADRIVRVVFRANINGGKINEASVMPPVAAALKNDYPEVEDATRLSNQGGFKISYAGKTFQQESFAFVDPNFFTVFTLPFLQGDAATALQQPNSLVITKDLAKKYFGNQSPMGKLLHFIDGNRLYTVTGVIEQMPPNAHFHFDMFGSMAGNEQAQSNSWMVSNFFTYLVLKKGTDYKQLEAKLPATVEKYMGPQIIQSMGINLARFRTSGNELGFALQPLTDIHLHSESNDELEPGGNARYVYIFSAIAFFMLLIAVINFINLSTAGATKRAREVGVRKVLGSGKFDLVKQFLVESILLSFVAVLFALALVQLALPLFNQLAGKNLSIGFSPQPVLLLLALGLLVGLLAGVYPAFFLAAFRPVEVLKGKPGLRANSFGLRSGLVVFQFIISVGMMIGTLVVYRQMQFIQNKQLGYDRDQLIVLSNSWALGKNEKAFKDQLLKAPGVVNITSSGYKPAGPSNSNNSLVYPEGNETQVMRTLRFNVDDQYIPTLGIQMATGRNFSPDYLTDSTAVILNETAVDAFGFKDNPIGKNITWMNDNKGGKINFHVIGVVKDFHFKSLHEAITPLLMVLQPEPGLIIKVKTTAMATLLAGMKQQWMQFNTSEPFSYAFMDDLYNKTYMAEKKTAQILNIIAVLTILVACMGLFGLATYTAEQRTKEIGIRKVLGASVAQVTGMISRSFIKLVLIACLIAFPIAWWAMHHWLQDFAYRVNIGWEVFLMAGFSSLLIALLTVIFQSLKAALSNPVKSLRTE